MSRKDVTKICFNTSKNMERKIIKLVENGDFNETKSSIINKILKKYFEEKKA